MPLQRGVIGLAGCDQVQEEINFTVEEGQAEGMSGSRWQQWYGMTHKGQMIEKRQAEEAAALLNDDEGEKSDNKKPKDTYERLVSGTYNSLDWMVLKRALAKCAKTTMGKSALSTLKPYEEVRDVERAHAAIAEARKLREQGVNLPISQVCSLVLVLRHSGFF